MSVLVFGATSLIAQECIRLWAATNTEFVLVGRSAERLQEVASDLQVRFPKVKAKVVAIDLADAKQVQKAVATAGKIELALVAQGSLTDQPTASSDLAYLANELQANAVTTALATEAIAQVLEKQNSGALGIIGSVAGDRGRAYNYSYGATKALLATYAAGLQQRFANSKVKVSLIKPGPTATPMTATHRGKMAPVDAVAKFIVAGMAKGSRVIYAPPLWKIIMLVVRSIPFAIFKKLNF